MKKTKIVNRILQILAVVALVGCITFGVSKLKAFALFNPDDAMRYSEYASKNTIEDSTIFYGTWLISMSAMTDELWEKAEQSASDSNQTDIYYKSELAGGAWFNVTDAGGLSDIMTTGEIVEESMLADLYVQYSVGSDGTVKDVKNGSEKNPFDIPDPYNLSRLPELQSLWIQYSNSKSAEGIDQKDYLKNHNSEDSGNMRTDIYNYQILTAFFSMDLKDSETDQLDADLARLWSCYQSLKSSGQDEEADIIYSLMSKVDAKRRAIVMDKLTGLDVNALGVLTSLANGKYYTTFGDFKDSESEDDTEKTPDYIRKLQDSVSHVFEEGENSDDDWWGPLQSEYDKYQENDDEDKTEPVHTFQADSALVGSINDSTANCQKSLNTYKSNALSDADSVLGHANYEYSLRVIEEASADGAAGPINYLRDTMNIQDNKIKNKDSELTLIDRSFLNLAEEKYESEVTAGEGEDYLNLLASGEGGAGADTALNTQLDNAEKRRSELEFLIDAYKQRETAANAFTYVESAISWTDGLYGGIPSDDFSAKATGSVDSHMKWLKDLRDSIKASDESLKDKLDNLRDKKDELQGKRDSALDDNDLAGAKKLDKQIEAVDQDIADEEAASGNSDTDSLADNILSDALADLADDPDADISGALNALAGMGDANAIDQLKDRADAAGASSEQKDKIDAAGDEADKNSDSSGDKSGDDDKDKDKDKDKGKSGSGSGGGSGSGAGRGTNMDADALLGIIGKDLGDLSMKELVYTCAALSRFAREGCRAAGDLAAKCTEIGREKNNKYFYSKYKDKSPEYISLKTLGDVSGYRYFYDNTRKEATMTSGASVYIFKADYDKVNNGGKDNNLKFKTVFSRYPYISEDDSKEIFGCDCEYVDNTSYSVCLTGDLEASAQDLLKKFEGDGE